MVNKQAVLLFLGLADHGLAHLQVQLFQIVAPRVQDA